MNRSGIVVSLILLLLMSTARVSAAERLVSLDLCVDQLLLQLVERERIVSLTWLSSDPKASTIADQLEGIYLNRGLAEELVPLQPDLVIAGDFGAGDAVSMLTRLGFRVERLFWPTSLEEIRQHILQLGEWVEEPQAAQQMVDAIEQQLAALDQHRQERSYQPRAIWYSANGVVVGEGTLEHELMIRVGLRNLIAEQGVQGFRQWDLEQLVQSRPEVIIVEGGYNGAFSLAGEYLHHPALAASGARLLELPAALSVCSAPVVAEVIQALQDALEENE